jgi:hypothetical protein
MREQIIFEIQRIAKASSNGRPPGQEAFEKISGIKKHTWLGKYWVKWSEALLEAGYEANKLNEKLELDIVFMRYALAVRLLCKVPTRAELDMLRTKDPTFPLFKSVIKQFNTKAELFAELKSWCARTPDFEDVAEMLPAYNAAPPSVPSMKPSIPSMKEGYVYLLKSGAFYKVGRGENLEKRVKQIRTALPDTSSLEHAIRTDDPVGIETYWHRRFDEKRANGEWFKLTTSDIAAFKKRKFQ